jgi:hypothetical protein
VTTDFPELHRNEFFHRYYPAWQGIRFPDERFICSDSDEGLIPRLAGANYLFCLPCTYRCPITSGCEVLTIAHNGGSPAEEPLAREDTMNTIPDWVTGFPGAVTVSDIENRIVYMNDEAAATWADRGGRALIGTNLLEYHNERSCTIIESLLATGGTNVYTIEKAGIRKLIYQSAWRNASGKVAGLVELSVVLPEGMPHFVRG